VYQGLDCFNPSSSLPNPATRSPSAVMRAHYRCQAGLERTGVIAFRPAEFGGIYRPTRRTTRYRH
jgi:hypothetical protein